MNTCDVCETESKEILECFNCNHFCVCLNCEDMINMCDHCEKLNCDDCCFECDLCGSENCEYCLKTCCQTCVTCACSCSSKYFKMLRLTTDLQCFVLQFLHIRDISQMSRTSKYFQKLSRKEILWKSLLKNHSSVAHDICCIESLSFMKTYIDIKSNITQYSSNFLSCCITLIGRGKLSYIFRILEKMLDNVVPSSGILDDNPNISKFEKYLAVINDCKDLVLDNHTLGLIHWKIFQDNKIALDYFISGMQKRDEKAEDCFTDGLKITKNLQFWVDCGLKNFPTQKYAVLYAAAKETKNLHFAEQSLLEFNINGSKKSNCHMFNNIGKCHILRLVGKCHFKTKSYKIAFDYWKLTLSSIGVFNSFAFRSYAFRIYKDIILLCIRYLKSTNEAQVYISELMIRLDDLMLSSSEDSDIAHWQAKCMQDYVSTSQWVSILNHHSQFLKMIRRSAHPKLESFANECQCIAHFHQFNFQESLTYGLKVQESKRSLRYIGKCFMKISQFEKAFEYFTKYVQIERNCIILLEFALLYSEIDSNYYDLEKSKQFYLEANEKKVHIRGKLSMEESVLFEQVLTRDKKRKRE